MKIDAKKIRIEFNNSSEDFWETTSESDIVFDEAMRMIAKAWEEHDASAEPLIKDKDEKVRKAVRAFSEVIQEKKHILVIKQCGRGMAEFSNGSNFWIRLPLSNETMNALEDRTYYTITELCGEEED